MGMDDASYQGIDGGCTVRDSANCLLLAREVRTDASLRSQNRTGPRLPSACPMCKKPGIREIQAAAGMLGYRISREGTRATEMGKLVTCPFSLPAIKKSLQGFAELLSKCHDIALLSLSLLLIPLGIADDERVSD